MSNREKLTDTDLAPADPERTDVGLKWLAEYGDFLFSYALSRVRDVQAAEDLVQETLLSAIRGIGSFENQSTHSTWLIDILRNKLVDYYRSKCRDQSLGVEHDASEHLHPFSKSGNWTHGVSTWTDPSSLMTQEEFQEVMQGCIGELPDLCRQAFEFRVMDELDPDETCRLLGVSATNLAARLYRARIAIRECLSLRWFTPE